MKIVNVIAVLLITAAVVLGCSKSAPNRGIIALTPSLADAVWALDAESDYPLIGVSPFTTDKRAADLPKIQNIGSVETISSLHPAIVLLHPSDQVLAEKLTRMRVSVMMHAMDTIEDIEKTLRDLGQFMNRSDLAEDVIGRMNSEIKQARAAFYREKTPEILVVIDRLDMRFQQLYIAQKPSYLAELVEGCGFQPLHLNDDSWSRIEAEKLIQRNPEYIVFFARSADDAGEIRKAFIKNYPMISAVLLDHLFVYDDPDITVPGPDIGKRQLDLCHFLRESN